MRLRKAPASANRTGTPSSFPRKTSVSPTGCGLITSAWPLTALPVAHNDGPLQLLVRAAVDRPGACAHAGLAGVSRTSAREAPGSPIGDGADLERAHHRHRRAG